MKQLIAAAIAALSIATPAQAQQCMANGWCYAYQASNGALNYVKAAKKQWPYVVYEQKTVGGNGPQGTIAWLIDCNSARYRNSASAWHDILPDTNGETIMQIVCR